MSVKVTLTCSLNADLFDELTAFLKANLPNVRNFDGNTRVDVYFDEAKTVMLLDEDWASVSHHQAYLAFIEEKGVLAQLASFLTDAPAISYVYASGL